MSNQKDRNVVIQRFRSILIKFRSKCSGLLFACMTGSAFASTSWQLSSARNLLFLTFITLPQQLTSAIQCYDSYVRGDPTQTSSCGEDQVCFSEFYALSDEPESTRIAEWYVDRFCVYRQQCLMRGIGPDCVTVDQLDKVVRRTFRKKLELHIKDGWRRLLYSQFCCCESDYCNRLDLNELHDLFNVSADSTLYFSSEITANCTYHLGISSIFLFALFFVVLNK